MYIEPDIKSSYNKHNIGKTIYNIIFEKKPDNILEFGVLHGYSTICIGQALRDIGHGTLTSYDLFEEYPYNHSRYDNVIDTIYEYSLDKIINLKRADFRKIDIKDNTLNLNYGVGGNFAYLHKEVFKKVGFFVLA